MTEETAITPTIYIPNVDYALQAWQGYQNLCRALLDDNDYAIIQGKKHRKRSGWTKLRRAFSITTQITEQQWEKMDDGTIGYYVTVRAIFPDGRYEDGDGYCDSDEFKTGKLKGTRHNIRAKAITRAKNRATADLIGSGELSAEEMPSQNGAPHQAKLKEYFDENGLFASKNMALLWAFDASAFDTLEAAEEVYEELKKEQDWQSVENMTNHWRKAVARRLV